jgi:hypothetical protein
LYFDDDFGTPSFASSSNFALSVSSIVNISKVSSPFLNMGLFLFSEDSKAEITRDPLLENFFFCLN